MKTGFLSYKIYTVCKNSGNNRKVYKEINCSNANHSKTVTVTFPVSIYILIIGTTS